jgi:hypothetical protein
VANPSDSERDRLRGAFVADPQLAHGPSTMLADLPSDTQAELVRRLAARLDAAPWGTKRSYRRSPIATRTLGTAPSASAVSFKLIERPFFEHLALHRRSIARTTTLLGHPHRQYAHLFERASDDQLKVR